VPTLKIAALAVLVLVACRPKAKPKATQAQCDAIVDRYAELVVREAAPDASPQEIRAEQERAKSEARSMDVLKNCASQVDATSYACAMKAGTTEALERCLE
jgi:hypothetical protein